MILIIPDLFVLWRVCGISPTEIFKNMLHVIIAIIVMILIYMLMGLIHGGVVLDVLTIIIALGAYLATLFSFKEERNQYLYPFTHNMLRFIRC